MDMIQINAGETVDATFARDSTFGESDVGITDPNSHDGDFTNCRWSRARGGRFIAL
jgi:hypothetical protein